MARKSNRGSGRRSAPKRPSKARGSGRGRFRANLGRWLFLLLLAAVLGGSLYLVYLDQVVRVSFEGKRWALPARVYARPLELYAGRALSADSLRAELELLGYARTAHPDRAGSYSDYKGRFLLRTRSFRFHDGRQPSRYLELRIDAGTVSSLNQAANGAELDLVRLDPALVASIYPSHNEDRVLVRRDGLPELLVRTLLAVEDRNFLQHHGVDPVAILRALWNNLRAGRVVQGGSTLTQQLVKNFYLSSERSLTRKANEALMSLLLDLRYDKDQILEAYANEIYLGQDGRRAIHGFGLAARFYFNRPLEELDLPRVALLVGMIKGPSYYDPRRHPERAKKRRDLVLDILAEQGLIDAAQGRRARDAPLGVSARGGRPAGRYPAFLDLVRRQLKRDYREEDLRSEGLSVFTTLDPLAQSRVETAVRQRLKELEKRKDTDQLEAAAVVAAVDNGEVLAVLGGRRSGYSGFNRALEASRPVGSLIKPLVYLDALAQPKRYTLATLLRDEPVSLKDRDGKRWSPQNFDGKSHGRVPLYLALARSYNLASVRLGLDLGLRNVLRHLERLGLDTPLRPLPSVLLGAVELSPLEIAQLYQVLASGGFRAPLRAVREVLDVDGRRLNRYPLQIQQVADPGPVYLVDWALRQVVAQGSARGLSRILPPDLPVAGKTGTTNDYRDSWFAGFSGDKVAVVWVGRDDNKPTGLTGAAGAMRVWGDIIARSDSTPLDLHPPGDVAMLWVDAADGSLTGSGCDGAVRMPFLRGSTPGTRSSCSGGDAGSEGNAQGNPVSDFFERFFE
jgi:penicillin-binding protein 1B